MYLEKGHFYLVNYLDNWNYSVKIDSIPCDRATSAQISGYVHAYLASDCDLFLKIILERA